jgi:hypothetical protein
MEVENRILELDNRILEIEVKVENRNRNRILEIEVETENGLEEPYLLEIGFVGNFY